MMPIVLPDAISSRTSIQVSSSIQIELMPSMGRGAVIMAAWRASISARCSAVRVRRSCPSAGKTGSRVTTSIPSIEVVAFIFLLVGLRPGEANADPHSEYAVRLFCILDKRRQAM